MKMAVFARTKRVTDPLDDRVKDRIVGRDRRSPAYVSSGSEHSAAASGGAGNDEFSSSSSSSSSTPNLSNLLDCFLHQDEDENGKKYDSDSDLESDLDCESDRTDAVVEIVVAMMKRQNVDRFRSVLMAHVSKGMEIFHSLRPNKQILHRNMMLFLQNSGYNAAICKTKWSGSGGLTAGSYEFIDVVRSDSGVRYYVDLDFAGEFEIARQTSHFHRISEVIPASFVGKGEDLKQIVKLISDAARRSLKSRGLLLPPWRKNRFMQNKWFGPYRRTANYAPASMPTVGFPASSTASTVVKCRRAIGFNAVSNGALFPAATRTR